MLKRLYFILAILAVAIGLVGIVTPVLPTTPFLILAASLFAKSSPRFHRWLLEHPTLGPPINQWSQHGVIKKSSKWLATFFIVLSGSFPLIVISEIPLAIRTVTFLVLTGVLIFIWSRPSFAPEIEQKSGHK